MLNQRLTSENSFRFKFSTTRSLIVIYRLYSVLLKCSFGGSYHKMILGVLFTIFQC